MTPEGSVKKEVKDSCKEYGIYARMPVTGGYGNSGLPDFSLCVYGWFVSIETKDDCRAHREGVISTRGRTKGHVTETNAPTDLQKKEMGYIRDAGGITLVVDTHNVMYLRSFFAAARVAKERNQPVETLIAVAKRLSLWYDRMPNYDI